VAFLEVGTGRLGVAEQGLFDDGVFVQAVVQCLSDKLVVEWCLGAVEHQEQQPEGLHCLDLDLGFEAVHVQVGDVLDGLDTAGLHGCHAGCRVREQQPGHALGQSRLGTVVVGKGFENDLVVLGR
jgi:hypothetical protein